MTGIIFSVMVIVSVISAIVTGNGEELTHAVLNEPAEAVELLIYLCGGMCFWGGLMRVAESSGLTAALAKAFSPLLGKLFKGLDRQGKAFNAICMNITANLLGLGNAATPFGIEAMKEMAREENAGDTATPSMIIFSVLNTSSITIIPATALSLRIKYGSADPSEIIPAVWITSAAALAAALTAAAIPMIKEDKHDGSGSCNSRHNADNSSLGAVEAGGCVRGIFKGSKGKS